MNSQFNGQELFSHEGSLVFIVEHIETDYVRVIDYFSGKAEVLFSPHLESATPEELEEAGI